MNILCIYGCVGWEPEDAWLHSAGASLFVDNAHNCTISEERLSRIKHDGSYPELSINYVLENAKLENKDIDIIGYVLNVNATAIKPNIKKILKREFENAKVVFVDHHLAHASATFFTSPFEDSSILTFDGAGNGFESTMEGHFLVETGFVGKGHKGKGDSSSYNGIVVMRHFKNGLERKSEFSLGEAYNHYSRIIYSLIEPKKAEKIENPFIFMETAPGKIMGLCAYGNKDKIKLPDIFEITYDNYFPTIYTNPYSDIRQVQKYEPVDLAAWLQYQFEEALLKYFDNLAYFGFSLDNLCLAGGCALNVLANKKILDSGIFKDVYVFPGANDSGLPFGGAIYLVHEYETENNTEFKIKLPENIGSLGRAYSVEEILEVVKQ